MPQFVMPLGISWAVLAIMVIALAIYRKLVSQKEDDYLHVSSLDASTVGVVADQAAVAAKLEKIDRWGKILTIATIAYGLLLAGIIIYYGWLESQKLQVG